MPKSLKSLKSDYECVEWQTVQCVMQKLPCCVAWFGVHIPLLTAFGGVQFDPSGKNITQVVVSKS
jgi:hypothetical protein